MERPALCIGPCRPDKFGGPLQPLPGSALCERCADKFPQHLAEIADMWDDLEAALVAPTPSGVGLEKVNGTADHGIDLNDAVAQLRSEVAGWAYFLAHAVIDERNSAGPADQSVPGILRWIADWHAEWLVRHEDNQLVAAVTEEARAHARDVRRRARPSGARRYDLPGPVPCPHTGTGDDGDPTTCPGTLFAIVSDRAIDGSDLICTANDEHRIPPHQWHRRSPAAPAPTAVPTVVWLSVPESAGILGVSVATTYIIASRDNWRRRQIGNAVRYAQLDVRASAERRERSKARPPAFDRTQDPCATLTRQRR